MRSHDNLAGVAAGEGPNIGADRDPAGLHIAAVCAAARALIASLDVRAAYRGGVLPHGEGWLYFVDLEQPRGSPAMRGRAEAREAYAASMACQLLKLPLPAQARADALRGDQLTAGAFALAGLTDNPLHKCVSLRRNVLAQLRDRVGRLRHISDAIECQGILTGAEISAFVPRVRALGSGPPPKEKPRRVFARRG